MHNSQITVFRDEPTSWTMKFNEFRKPCEAPEGSYVKFMGKSTNEDAWCEAMKIVKRYAMNGVTSEPEFDLLLEMCKNGRVMYSKKEDCLVVVVDPVVMNAEFNVASHVGMFKDRYRSIDDAIKFLKLSDEDEETGLRTKEFNVPAHVFYIDIRNDVMNAYAIIAIGNELYPYKLFHPHINCGNCCAEQTKQIISSSLKNGAFSVIEPTLKTFLKTYDPSNPYYRLESSHPEVLRRGMLGQYGRVVHDNMFELMQFVKNREEFYFIDCIINSIGIYNWINYLKSVCFDDWAIEDIIQKRNKEIERKSELVMLFRVMAMSQSVQTKERDEIAARIMEQPRTPSKEGVIYNFLLYSALNMFRRKGFKNALENIELESLLIYYDNKIKEERAKSNSVLLDFKSSLFRYIVCNSTSHLDFKNWVKARCTLLRSSGIPCNEEVLAKFITDARKSPGLSNYNQHNMDQLEVGIDPDDIDYNDDEHESPDSE